VKNKGIQELEQRILFSPRNTDQDISFMHNDFSLSNTIVDNDRIVGLVDWEMAGWFGWQTAAEVHMKIRTPKRENFASFQLPEDLLQDILYWNDLYE
jgi:COMPASS component SPP1